MTKHHISLDQLRIIVTEICEWNPQFYAVQAEDRRSGYYVHHSHKTSEFLGGRTHAFQTEYDRPSKFFNIAKFREAGVTACVCARIHILDTLGKAFTLLLTLILA